MVKISIIMPVYNCEKYLQESIESVFKQNLKEWELICIDDGSTDNSNKILKEYEKNDCRIKVYQQQNAGAGVARNLGLRYAKGEYVAFLDADDFYLDINALQKMYEKCINNKVNACGSNLRLLRNGVIVEDSGFKEVKQSIKEKKVLSYKDFQFDYGYCGFIIKRELLMKNNIIFPLYRRFQDPPFLVKAMTVVEKFCFVDNALYCYRTPNVSTRFDSVRVTDLLKGLITNLDFAVSNNLELLFETTLQRLEQEYCNIILHNISVDNTDILELLIKANNIVRSKKKEYIILPLQKIIKSIKQVENCRKEYLHSKMEKCKRIFIYGAGKATTDFLLYLKRNELFEKVDSIIVTNKNDNPDKIEKLPVITLDDYRFIDGDIILITVTSIYQKEIVHNLEKLQIYSYEIVDTSMLDINVDI